MTDLVAGRRRGDSPRWRAGREVAPGMPASSWSTGGTGEGGGGRSGTVSPSHLKRSETSDRTGNCRARHLGIFPSTARPFRLQATLQAKLPPSFCPPNANVNARSLGSNLPALKLPNIALRAYTLSAWPSSAQRLGISSTSLRSTRTSLHADHHGQSGAEHRAMSKHIDILAFKISWSGGLRRLP